MDLTWLSNPPLFLSWEHTIILINMCKKNYNDIIEWSHQHMSCGTYWVTNNAMQGLRENLFDHLLERRWIDGLWSCHLFAYLDKIPSPSQDDSSFEERISTCPSKKIYTLVFLSTFVDMLTVVHAYHQIQSIAHNPIIMQSLISHK